MSAPAERARSDLAAQLLGFAFAAGDLLVEVRDDGVIVLAIGAATAVTGHSEAALAGMSLSEIVSGDVDAAALAALAPGVRLGPLAVRLHSGCAASLRLYRLPQPGGNVSGVLALETGPVVAPPARPAGLVEPSAFSAVVADVLASVAARGAPLNLDLVELAGLDAAVAAMDSHAREQVRREVESVLGAASLDGAAAEVAPDRFAVISSDAAPVEVLVSRLAHLSRVGVEANAARLPLQGHTPDQNLRTLRYALDRYIEDGAAAAQAGFSVAMERTLCDSARFKAIVAERAFHLAYQPVVRMGDEGLHHYEALARFDADGSPADTIRLAEELGMIESFDLAVAEMVAAALAAAPAEVRIAVNVSARSLVREGFVDRFLAVSGADDQARGRMLVEITETAALGDLNRADDLIQILRGDGHMVCLDDFGAGAASLEYIQRLRVDFLKVDGRYIRELDQDARSRTVVKHLIALCHELRMVTIVEMVETREVARLAAELGAQLAQGYLFGKAQPEPTWSAPKEPANARRIGAVERWG
jgi:EAL domain-containing protein (putative c-di-GMP-specific phosphodiesterase class I)